MSLTSLNSNPVEQVSLRPHLLWHPCRWKSLAYGSAFQLSGTRSLKPSAGFVCEASTPSPSHSLRCPHRCLLPFLGLASLAYHSLGSRLDCRSSSGHLNLDLHNSGSVTNQTKSHVLTNVSLAPGVMGHICNLVSTQKNVAQWQRFREQQAL